MFCKRCGTKMKYVMSFEGNRSYEYYRCPKCYYTSKRIPLIIRAQNGTHRNEEIIYKRRSNKKNNVLRIRNNNKRNPQTFKRR